MTSLFRLSMLSGLLIALLAACGQKGPLVLSSEAPSPQETPQKETPPAEPIDKDSP